MNFKDVNKAFYSWGVISGYLSQQEMSNMAQKLVMEDAHNIVNEFMKEGSSCLCYETEVNRQHRFMDEESLNAKDGK